MGAGYKTVGSVIRLARLGTGLFNQVNIGVGLLSTSHPMLFVRRKSGSGFAWSRQMFTPLKELAGLVRESFLQS